MATHITTRSEGAEWTSELFYTFGRDGSSNLNWFDAKDPRRGLLPLSAELLSPKQTLPSRTASSTSLADDENARQIDWDQLYFANGKNLYSVENANGVIGNTVTA
jgi:hypothetical protein